LSFDFRRIKLSDDASAGADVANTVISSDFLGSTTQERVAMCRKLAAEAAQQAESASNPETKRSYSELKRQWEVLATELEATNARP